MTNTNKGTCNDGYYRKKEEADFESSDFNHNLRTVSFGFYSFSEDNPSGRCWIGLHEPGTEKCQVVWEGFSEELEEGGLRRILDALDRKYHITITDVGIVSIPVYAGIRERLTVEQMCLEAGIGKPFRILRTPSLEAYGYVCTRIRQGYRKQDVDMIRLIIRADHKGAVLTLLSYGNEVEEQILCRYIQWKDSSFRITLQNELQLIWESEEMGRALEDVLFEIGIVLYCVPDMMEECLKGIMEISPDVNVEIISGSSNAASGAGALLNRLLGNTDSLGRVSPLLLDITTASYEICRGQEKKPLVIIEKGTTIPTRYTETVYAKDICESPLYVYENGKICGIMNPSPDLTDETVKVVLSIEIEADGQVIWKRNVIAE